MDIAEIRRKAKELKARELEAEGHKPEEHQPEELKDITAPSEEADSLIAEDLSLEDESTTASNEDFIIDDEGGEVRADALTEEFKDVADDDAVFELTGKEEVSQEEFIDDINDDDELTVDNLVDDPPPLEESASENDKKELPEDKEVSKLFTDDPDIGDSLDAIITPDEPASDEMVEEGIAEAQEEESEEDEDAVCLEAITFMLDDEEYGIDIEGIKEVIKTRELTSLPRAPQNIMGLLSLRGLIVPIMDLRKRLAMGYDKEGERIIIVKDGDEHLGLVVDRIVGAVSLRRANIEPPPSFSSIDGELISAICRYDGEAFILLNVDRILGN
ncbi:MAG: chemotaxis protein CheW [Deltaproteobacteria bacterium]|nr:chemotaxis protein CheW [Deltaproteobacteria bacterium]